MIKQTVKISPALFIFQQTGPCSTLKVPTSATMEASGLQAHHTYWRGLLRFGTKKKLCDGYF